MSVNSLNFEQVSTVLTSIVEQATNQSILTPTDTGSFVSVAQVALRADRDSVMQAISNVLARTIFSIRPYEARFKGLDMDTFRWGGMMRKLSIADSDWDDDEAYDYPIFYDANQTPPDGEGLSIDRWKIKKPNILQTNFYGQSVYADHMTITEDQLETAFTGPDQFGSFLSLLMTNLSNRLEMSNEALRRGLVCNAIGALYEENNSERVIHLLSEYNSLAGITPALTSQTVYDPANFPAFCKWVYSRVAEITDLFTANSTMFQTVITGKPILRHTPYVAQKVYLFAPFQRQMEARVLADTYHDNYLKYADVETVPFWQSISARDSVKVTPSYVDTSGALVTSTAQTVEPVFGLIFDQDAMGMTITDRRVLSTPLNESGLYRNIWVHGKQRIVFDNTEKCALLLLD